jgi:hypothetical protein
MRIPKYRGGNPTLLRGLQVYEELYFDDSALERNSDCVGSVASAQLG